MNSFSALGIKPTQHKDVIKQAYYTAILEHLTKTPPDHLATLHRHYIKAVRHARSIFIAHPGRSANRQSHAEQLGPLSSQPNTYFILIELAEHYLERNKYRIAIDILNAMQVAYATSVDIKKRLTKAESIWCSRLTKRFHHLSSEDTEYLIEHMMRHNRHREALTLLSKAISKRSQSLYLPNLLQLSAQCMAALRIDTAPHYFDKALECTHKLNENPRDILLAYVEYLFSFKQFDTLLLLVDDLIKLDPNQHRYHFLKGEALRQTHHLTESITCFRYAIGLAPQNTKYYHLIARAYRDVGNASNACAYAQAGDDINP